ncbi:TetR/AcrR family transcriptional regulator [Gryllotalpicola reticulitermitis]|uniref:TetR/AcrR family transcriptional regulator n=1 Tax=Gryllotalpicola reticulitermitis TaxID=1184153 RepID=A0ABV8Q477_9MICO
MTTAFARARSEEQRDARRAAILSAADELLRAGTRVGALSLNGLARHVGLAKSNVLRYFETREAVLLALLDREYGEWLDALEMALAGADAAPAVEVVADAVARTAAQRPVLAELVANSATVLEHNVSAEVAADYKRSAYAQSIRLVQLIEDHVGELPHPSRIALAATVNLVVGGAWSMCRPSPGMAEAYEKYPELSAMRLDYRVSVRELTAAVLTGLLVRPASDRA